MKCFVVVFLFNPDLTRVVMIRKQRPDWMKGLLNGVGGHVEVGELPLVAVVRELEEETGLRLEYDEFHRYVVIHRKDRDLYCYYALGDPKAAKSPTDEQIEVHNVENLLNRQDVVVDTKWILAMAREAAAGAEHGYSILYEIQDQGVGGPWESLL